MINSRNLVAALELIPLSFSLPNFVSLASSFRDVKDDCVMS